MLSSNQGLLPEGRLDMDAISDITSISMDKINNDECGSQHSGSIGSDNTEVLLTQNISLNEFDCDDSLLESVSQVGENDAYIQQSFSPPSKQNKSTNNYSYLSSYASGPTGMENEFLFRADMSENKYSLQGLDHKTTQKTVAHHKALQNQADQRPRFNPEQKKDKVNDQQVLTKYSIKKFPSDPNILSNGRQSVIKHHNSMPSVNLEASFISTSTVSGNDIGDGQVQKHSILVEDQGNKPARKSQQVWFHPATYPNGNDKFEDGLLMQQTRHEQATQEKFDRQGSSKPVKEINSEDMVGSFPPSRNSGTHGGYGGNINSDIKETKESLEDYSGNRGPQEMLLGVKHDPDTNELYDDKVREGADILSKILHGDPNSSFTSFSSTSRSSEKSDVKLHFRPHENKSQTPQRSLDSSLNSEPKTKTSSSPRNGDERSSRSSFGINVGTQNGVSLKRQTISSLTRDAKQQSQWFEKRPEINGKQMGHEGTLVSGMDNKGQVVVGTSSGCANGKWDYEFNREDQMRRQTLEAAPGSESSSKNEYEVSDIDEHFENKVEELRRLEVDIDEIHSRKKMAIQELGALEQSLDRNKADMSSSENLVEQYRWQATQTRSELMELEKTRNHLQEDCNSLNEVLKKSKRNETFNGDEIMFGRSKEEIFTCLQERDQFQRELVTTEETLKRERERAKWAQDDLREKIRVLEEDLRKQQEEAKENLQELKEKLNKERQKVRIVQHDKLNAINNLHDEMKLLQEKEIEAIKAQMLRERTSALKLSEEKFKRDANRLKKTAETAESRIKQLETSLVERNEEINKLRVQVREEKQKNLDVEKKWRAQLESERQNCEIKVDEQERFFKDREEKLLHKHRDLENLLEERTGDLRRSEERCRAQTEELHKIIENKNEEVKLVRGLVRQQEDATRVLGERLRTEAREHVRNAVEKERESLNKEKGRISRTVDDEKEKHARIVKQLTDQLEMENESHLQTKQTMNKLKQEAEGLRKQVVDVHGEKITSVQRARQEGSEELGKIREKLHEFTLQADKLERLDKETANAIYEECRKVAELVGISTPFKTATRFPNEKPDRNATEIHESPTKEALVSLKRCNEELRQRLSDMKKQMEHQKAESEKMKTNISLTEDVSKHQKLVEEKDEEIQQLHRKYGDEIKHLQEERKKDQISYRRTVAKLEHEFHKLLPTNVSTGSSRQPRIVKREVITKHSSENNSKNAANYVPQASSTAEGSSSTDLLKHLQDRVKKLRAENENLKKSSDKETKETPVNSVNHSGKIKSFSNSDSVLSQSKSLSISQLHSTNKISDTGMHHHFKRSSGNIEQVTRLQRLLNSTTKEDTKRMPTNTG